MGLLDKLHRPFFDSIHRDRLRTDNWQNLAAWLEKQGVDTKKFETTFKSFGVQSKTKRAIRLTTGYKIDGTPAMAVHGRYTVPSSEGMLGTVNQLVAQVRKQK
jgi:thiol:disulfide interchange protein DsbA